MVLVIIFISLWFYLKYFTENLKDVKKNLAIEKVDENQNSTSTYINDINYVSTDVRGNKYQITAKLAEIKIENPDLMFLSDVVAFVFIKDKDTVKITSNFGKYNTNNYDTIFSKDVIIRYLDNKITGDYLDLSLIRNNMIVSKNVNYTNSQNLIKADVIEVDIKTKDTKIFMHEGNKKVSIKSLD